MFQRNNNKPNPYSQTCMPELTQQLFELKSLLKEKYQNIKANVTFGNGEVKVSLLNGRNGIHEGIDEENERPIEFLKSFDAKITKEKAEHSYWSYSVVKLDESKLKQVIEGLKILPSPEPEANHGKMMARC